MLIRLGLLLIAAAASSGCVIVADVDTDWDWNGNWVERTQGVEDVERVEFNARGTLYITQGPRSALKVEGNKQALEQLRIEQRDGTLLITQAGDKHRWFEFRGRNEEPVFSLEVSHLEEIRHGGHGEIKLGPFTLESLHIETADHARTYIASINAREVELSAAEHAQVRVETLDSDAMTLTANDHADVYIEDASVLDAEVHVRSHGEVWLSGKGDSMDITLQDHGDLEAQSFASAIATVLARDHARAEVRVADEISLDQRDHASVVVTGDPQLTSAGF